MPLPVGGTVTTTPYSLVPATALSCTVLAPASAVVAAPAVLLATTVQVPRSGGTFHHVVEVGLARVAPER